MKFKATMLFIVYSLIAILIPLITIEIAYVIYIKFSEDYHVPRGDVDFTSIGIFIKDSDVGYVLNPGKSTTDLPDWEDKKESYDKIFHGAGKLISINSAGYRGKLYEPEKPPKTIRILTLGDSATFGPFNDDGETWPDYLESTLQEAFKDKNIQVINGGVGGYTSAHILEIVRKKFQYYQPDIVIFGEWYSSMYYRSPQSGPFPEPDADFYVNDSFYKRNDPQKAYNYYFPGVQALLRRSSLLVGHWKIKQLASPNSIDDKGNPTREYFKKYYTGNKIWIKDYLNNLSQIKQLIKSQTLSTEFYIVAMPTFFVPGAKNDFLEKPSFPEYDIPLYHQKYRPNHPGISFIYRMYYHHVFLFQNFTENRVKQLGWNLISGYGSLGKLSIDKRKDYFTDQVHLTKKGNNLLAMDITNQIVALSDKF